MSEKKQSFHFVAIGGAVMHGLAIEMKELGHEVSGSDDVIFDPSKSKLKEHGLLPEVMGWDASRIHPGLDAIILGMHAHRDNPELLQAQRLGLQVFSFPEFVNTRSHASQRIVIAGSHGKTTISAMLVHLLNIQGIPFDYLLGAEVPGVEGTVRLRGEDIMIFEGDEYLSSRIDSRPKFVHYDADILVVTGIAWDHFNVYPTMDSYINVFDQLLQSTRRETQVLYCGEDELLTEVISRSSHLENSQSYFRLSRNGDDKVRIGDVHFDTEIFGEHNDQNLSACWEVARRLGISLVDFAEAMSYFRGAQNRLERQGSRASDFIVFRDYAHSPSKLQATLKAVHDRYQGRKIVAIYELHTYSSMSTGFLAQYEHTMDLADMGIVFYDDQAASRKRLAILDVQSILLGFGKDDLLVCTSQEEMAQQLSSLGIEEYVFLFMSSGSYGGFDISGWMKSKLQKKSR